MDISIKQTLFLGTNGVRFIEIPLYFLYNQRDALLINQYQRNSLFSQSDNIKMLQFTCAWEFPNVICYPAIKSEKTFSKKVPS